MGVFLWRVYGGFVCTRICDGDDVMITNRILVTICLGFVYHYSHKRVDFQPEDGLLLDLDLSKPSSFILLDALLKFDFPFA